MVGEAPHEVPDRGGRTLMKMEDHSSKIGEVITGGKTIEMIMIGTTPMIVIDVMTGGTEIDHLIEDLFAQRLSFLALMEAIHTSGSTRRSTISPSMRSLKMRGSKLPASTLMTKQVNGGDG